MPRSPRRALLHGYPLHVLQRGHNKARCFSSDADHALYLGLLQEYSARYGCAIHAYVLMSNHVHLLMSPPDIPRLSRMMQGLNQIFGQHVNRQSARCGAIWQGRFKASLVDSGKYFLTCQRYIELNPVRAGMVDAVGLYPWSSYGTNAEGKPSLFLSPHARYLELGDTTARRLASYRGLFSQAISAEVIARIRSAIHRNRPIGDDEFVAWIDRLSSSESSVPSLSLGTVPGLSPV